MTKCDSLLFMDLIFIIIFTTTAIVLLIKEWNEEGNIFIKVWFIIYITLWCMCLVYRLVWYENNIRKYFVHLLPFYIIIDIWNSLVLFVEHSTVESLYKFMFVNTIIFYVLTLFQICILIYEKN